MRNWLLLGIMLLACLPLLEVGVRITDPPLLHGDERVLLMSAVPLRDARGFLRQALMSLKDMDFGPIHADVVRARITYLFGNRNDSVPLK